MCTRVTAEEGVTGRRLRPPAWSNYIPALLPGWPTPAKACFGCTLGGNLVRHPHELTCQKPGEKSRWRDTLG